MARPKIKIVDVDLSSLPTIEDEDRTLEEAQQTLGNNIAVNQKFNCECCGRSVKPYGKKLTPVIVARLIVLVARYWKSKDWEPIPQTPEGKNPQFTDLEYWDLITVEKVGRGKEPKVKPTREGYDFVRKVLELPTHCFFFNGSAIAWGATRINCEEALEDKYDYKELFDLIPVKKKAIKQ